MPDVPPDRAPLPVQGGYDSAGERVVGKLSEGGILFVGDAAPVACSCGCQSEFISEAALKRHLSPPAEAEPGPAVPIASQWKLELRPVTEHGDGP